MAFGLAGSETGSGGDFLKGRLQYDARVGFWKTVDRQQESDGTWTSNESEPFKDVTFLCDMGGLEVGYSQIASPPVFILVPYGQPTPPQPTEMIKDDKGKTKKAFSPCFRVKILAPKIFGDAEPRYFSSNAKTVMGPFESLWNAFTASPDAATGKIPIVACKGTTVIEVKTPQGTSKFYAPNLVITGFQDRPEVFGERTVPIPAKTAAPAAPVHHASPANHVPPPAAKVAPVAAFADSEMPF